MSERDRLGWNERHAQRASKAGQERWLPLAALRSLEPLLRPRWRGARALDLACGSGRNALYLAELGYRVDAWDISEVALQQLDQRLSERAREGAALSVHPRQIDLDRASIRPESYDLVLVSYFLDRALFPALAAALRPGGLLFYETILESRGDGSGSSGGNYRLRPGELRSAWPGLEILEQAEDEQGGWARLLARAPERPKVPD